MKKNKVQFGCGNRRFSGWDNFDYEIDISKKLPFDDNSLDIIFTNHNLEHVTIHEAFGFLEECYRVISPNGVVRLQVPSIEKINSCNNLDYIQERGGSLSIAVKNVILLFGHKSAYTSSLLKHMLIAVGFLPTEHDPRFSPTLEIQEAINANFGKDEINYDIETICFESRKQ